MIAKKLDRSHLHFLEAAEQALASFSIPEKSALIVGESKSSLTRAWELIKNEQSNREDSTSGVHFLTTLARFAKAKNMKGGHVSIDAACASSLAAIHAAIRELRSGRQDLVVTGGVGISVNPLYLISFARCRALSSKGSYPLDSRADGIVLGEGSVVFVLKRLEDAQKEGLSIYGIIRGGGGSSDGRGQSMMTPQLEGQALAIERALNDAQINRDSVQVIECHATGTPLGDQIEIQSIYDSYLKNSNRSNPLWIGSVKRQVGHTIGAAGAAGLLKLVLSMQNKTLPPTPISETPLSISSDKTECVIPQNPVSWPNAASGLPRTAAVSAFGFGGTNWHVILEEGHSQKLSKSKGEKKKHPLTAFLFPGHGSPYPNMGYSLYERYALFRRVFEEANTVLSAHLRRSLESLIFTEFGSSIPEIEKNLLRPDWVQPLLLTVNTAFDRLTKDFGIQPDAVAGHSVGEFSAAVSAGILDFESALLAIYERGKVYQDLREQKNQDTGKMLAVFENHLHIIPILQSFFHQGLAVATLNTSSQTVISGPSDLLLGPVLTALRSHSIHVRILPIEIAWHSSLAHSLGARHLEPVFSNLPFQSPRISFLSNVENEWYHKEKSYKKDELSQTLSHKWIEQLRAQMNFVSLVQEMKTKKIDRFIEIGPKKILASFTSEILGPGKETIQSTEDLGFF